MRSALRRLDLVFCVELTAGMGGVLEAARGHAGTIVGRLRAELGDDLRVGFVGYRDGSTPPEVLDLSSDAGRLAKEFDAATARGAGDSMEALFAAMAKCLELTWAEGSYRVVILVGRPPSSSVGPSGDAYLRHPVGLAVDDLAIRLHAAHLFVHAVSASPQAPHTSDAFSRWSQRTAASFDVVASLAQELLRDLDFDAKLLPLLEQGIDEDGFDGPWREFLEGRMRLRQRGLFKDWMAVNLELSRLIKRAMITHRVEDLEAAAMSVVRASYQDSTYLDGAASALVSLADKLGLLPKFEANGFLSDLARSQSSEALHVAANAYRKLGNAALAAELQNQSAALEGPVDASMSEEDRVGSAIENYETLGSLSALAAAVEVFLEVELDVQSTAFMANRFAAALEKHQHWRTLPVERLLTALSSPPPQEELLLRMIALICWRRGETEAAARWQAASIAAPESVAFGVDEEHSWALRMNKEAR